jgi:hypothetical protein
VSSNESGVQEDAINLGLTRLIFRRVRLDSVSAAEFDGRGFESRL